MTWARQLMAGVPRDRRILLEDGAGNFAVASWRAVKARSPAWVVSAGRGVVVTFEDPAAWYDLPEARP
ncbi:MAG TPA: hypothetical protein VF605_11825 [Allosphingosinicella sp.]|jgi:hypothetical protein